MNSQEFAFWLQGFVELQDSDSISDKQWLVIKDHLKLVFDKVTPEYKIDIKPSVLPGRDWTKITDLFKQQQYPIDTSRITC